jgi:hypothetical protein
MPLALSSAALRVQAITTSSAGRSASEAIRPNWPIASSSVASSATSFPFQNPNVQCALNAAICASGPWNSKAGDDHFIVSTTSRQPACTSARSFFRIGRANGAAFAM